MRPRARAVFVSIGLVASAGLFFGHLTSGCFFMFEDDCTRSHGYGCMTGATVSSSSGGGGTGGMPGCSDAGMCPPPSGPCVMFGTATCTNHTCGISYVAGDLTKAYGTCQKPTCDTSGAMSYVNDDTNIYDDGNPCTTDTCMNGAPSNVLNKGAPCATGICEPDPFFGLPACVECDPGDSMACSSSPGTSCVSNKCVPGHCKNNTKDFGETDIDCGGATSNCPRCGIGEKCTTYKDCASGICDAMKSQCVAPSCTDNKQNGYETDVDCGGTTCPPCPDSFACSSPKDCMSKVCMPMAGGPNVCQAPSCKDGVQNGDEDGVDCGGAMSACPPCPK